MLEKQAELLAAGALLPVAAIYRSRGLDWQGMRALCGPTSVANVLRSVGEPVDPHHVLDGTGLWTLFGLRLGGMTLDQVADALRRRTARRVTVLRDLTLGELRQHLEAANDPVRRYLANFHRGPIFGWGGGHHSPLAGYLASDDAAIVYDTNRGVGPWAIDAPTFHAALSMVDPATGKRRGLVCLD